jgi:hypothetical protein
MITLMSSEVCFSASCSVVTPNRRAIRLATAVRPTVNGARQPPRGSLGARDGDQLRDQFAHGHVDDRDEREGDRHGERGCHRVGEAAEHRLQQLRQGWLAEEADPDRAERDPHLTGGDVLLHPVDLAQRQLGSPLALVRHHLEARPPRAHQADLGRHE